MLSWLPKDVSTYGPQIDRIFHVIYYVTGATFFIVQGLLLVFLVLYRHREGRRGTYTHGNTTLEIAWTIALGLGAALVTALVRRIGYLTKTLVERRIMVVMPAVGVVVAVMAIGFAELTDKGTEQVLFSGHDALPGLVANASSWSMRAASCPRMRRSRSIVRRGSQASRATSSRRTRAPKSSTAPGFGSPKAAHRRSHHRSGPQRSTKMPSSGNAPRATCLR